MSDRITAAIERLARVLEMKARDPVAVLNEAIQRLVAGAPIQDVKKLGRVTPEQRPSCVFVRLDGKPCECPPDDCFHGPDLYGLESEGGTHPFMDEQTYRWFKFIKAEQEQESELRTVAAELLRLYDTEPVGLFGEGDAMSKLRPLLASDQDKEK